MEETQPTTAADAGQVWHGQLPMLQQRVLDFLKTFADLRDDVQSVALSALQGQGGQLSAQAFLNQPALKADIFDIDDVQREYNLARAPPQEDPAPSEPKDGDAPPSEPKDGDAKEDLPGDSEAVTVPSNVEMHFPSLVLGSCDADKFNGVPAARFSTMVNWARQQC